MAYTTIDVPELYFQTKLYTGSGNIQSITLDGDTDMQPDFIWAKSRGENRHFYLADVIRGVKSRLRCDNNDEEYTANSTSGFDSFDSDGFTLEEDSSSLGLNESSHNMVSWNWKGGGSASANSDGSTASSVSANTTAGFSVVSYTGAGATTYGHGLGATPNVIIIKKRTSDSGNNNWFVYHDKVITAGGSNKSFLTLNETGATTANGSATTFTSVSSTTFGVGTDDIISESSHTFIAYCFAEKKGYSKFGSYKGNGDNDGIFIYTGFKPAWVLTRQTNGGNYWHIHDNRRNAFNVRNTQLKAGNSAADETPSGGENSKDFVSNGFKFRDSDHNNQAQEYLYMAFAENPFVSSNGIPVNAE